MRRYLLMAFALVSLATLSVACKWRPLEDLDDTVIVKVIIDAEDVKTVTSDIYNPAVTVPSLSSEMMRVIFYNPSSGSIVTQAFIYEKSVLPDGRECITGRVRLMPGTYDLVCYNFDMAYTQVRGENKIAGLYADAEEISPYLKSRLNVKSGEGAPVVTYQPDHLIVSRDRDVVVTPHSGEEFVIETIARTCVDSYYIQVGVKNAQYVLGMSAVVDGLACGNYFGKDERDYSKNGAVYFEMVKSKDPASTDSRDVLCAVFNTFGKHIDASSSLRMTLNVKTKASVDMEYSFSLDDIFRSENAINHHWLLIDNVIDVPEPDKPVDGNNGFDPRVDDWEDHEETIIM